MLENNPGMISCEELCHGTVAHGSAQCELQLPAQQRRLGGGSGSCYRHLRSIRAMESAEKPNFTEALTSWRLSVGWQGTATSILRAKGEEQS